MSELCSSHRISNMHIAYSDNCINKIEYYFAKLKLMTVEQAYRTHASLKRKDMFSGEISTLTSIHRNMPET